MTNLTKMHAVRRIAGIIALFAVIGFLMTACGNGNGNGYDNGNNSTGSGGLTITNMDAYIGCYIHLSIPVPPTTDAADKVTYTYNPSTGDSTVYITPTKIASGTVRLNVWESTGPRENLKAKIYTGSSTGKYVVYLYILKQGGNPTGVISGVNSGDFDAKGVGFASLAFTDGKATLNSADINWNFINP